MRGTSRKVSLHKETYSLSMYLEIEKIKIQVRGEKSID
jgi:hypothetical protein